MPRKPKSEKRRPSCWRPIAAEILDQIVRDGPLTAEEVETASRRFKKALIERALGAELTHHLGYAPGAAKPERDHQPAQRHQRQDGAHRRWSG